MASSRSYVVRDPGGQETGPFDQDTLVKMAENGAVTPLHEIRSTLVPQWEQAGDVRFLKETLKKKMEAIHHPKPSLLRRIGARAGRRCDLSPLKSDDKTARHSRAKLAVRLLAGLTDLVVVLLLAVLAAAVCFFLVRAGAVDPAVAGTGLVVVSAMLHPLYFILTISCSTQTFGQKTWGIFLMRGDDDRPFYAGRIFVYALLLPFFAVLTPIAAKTNPSGRSWQEVFSGLTLVKVKFNKSDR